MSARNTYRKIALANGLKTTNFLASPTLATSYNLTLPSSTPTIAGQSLISDTTGTLSWGSSVATVSTFTGTTNPVTTATNVTGLLFTVPSSFITVYIALNATTNIYAVYSLYAYQKGSASSWGLAYSVNGDSDDDTGVVFSITSTGQVQYTLGATIAGFSSVVFMWTLGTAVSNTLTSLALSSTLNVGGASTFTAGIQGTSLNLSSTFNVAGLATHNAMTGTTLSLGTANLSGALTSTVGTVFTIQPQAYTDTVTSASSTAAGNFSASYIGIPTLNATNTVVTTPVASTLTIAGAPVAGTNETITNALALNVLSGNVVFGGSFRNNQKDVAFWKSTATAVGPTSGPAIVPAGNWTASAFSAASILNAFTGNSVFTANIPGEYALALVVNMSTTAAPNNIAYIQFVHSTLGVVAGNSFFSNSSGTAGPVSCSTTVRIGVGETVQPQFYLSSGYSIQLTSLTISAVKEYAS